MNEEFARLLLGCELPLTAASQRNTFNTLVAETLHEDCTYETVKTIHETLNGLLEERKDDPEPLTLDKDDVKRLLSASGVSNETVRRGCADRPVRLKRRADAQIRDPHAEYRHQCQTGMRRSD